jgi:hypothetical protein
MLKAGAGTLISDLVNHVVRTLSGPEIAGAVRFVELLVDIESRRFAGEYLETGRRHRAVASVSQARSGEPPNLRANRAAGSLDQEHLCHSRLRSGARSRAAFAPGLHALPLALALISACLTASANYTLNEFLDAQSDSYHPLKGERPRRPRIAR